MKYGDPLSQVELAHVDQCIKAAGPARTRANPKPRNSIRYSRFRHEPLLNSNMPVSFIKLVSAIIRTSAAGMTVSVKSTAATTSLAEGVLKYLQSTPYGLTVDAEFHELKEFVGTTYTGVLGAGLAYLRMLHDEYVWKAHYEELKLSAGGVAQAEPDFAFAKAGDIALVEAKGTGKNLDAAITAAKNGYLRQIDPAAKRALQGNIIPSCGYAFCTALNTGLQQTSSFVQMAMVFREFSSASRASPSLSKASAPSGVQPVFVSVLHIQRANYKEVLTQLGLDINNLGAAAQLPMSDDTLYQSPWRHALQIDGEPWTATIALPMNILRGIYQGRYPEGLAEAIQNRGPTIRPGKNDPNLIFVNFPDHTRVLLRRGLAGESSTGLESVLE